MEGWHEVRQPTLQWGSQSGKGDHWSSDNRDNHGITERRWSTRWYSSPRYDRNEGGKGISQAKAGDRAEGKSKSKGQRDGRGKGKARGIGPLNREGTAASKHSGKGNHPKAIPKSASFKAAFVRKAENDPARRECFWGELDGTSKGEHYQRHRFKSEEAELAQLRYDFAHEPPPSSSSKASASGEGKRSGKGKPPYEPFQPFDADEGRGGHKGDLYRQHRALQEEIETAQRSAPTKGPTSPTSSRTPDEKLADDRRMQHILTRSAESESQFSAQTVEQSIFS